MHMFIYAFLPGYGSFARRQLWLSSACCTSPEGLGATDFSGSKIHFHLALKNWHQICKWLVCELLIEALSKSQINAFQREIVMYLPCALAHVPRCWPTPAGAPAQAEALVWGAADSASRIKIRGTETSVGGQREIGSWRKVSLWAWVKALWDVRGCHSLHSVLIAKQPRQRPRAVLPVERSGAAG